jgi:hypothetical protein
VKLVPPYISIAVKEEIGMRTMLFSARTVRIPFLKKNHRPIVSRIIGFPNNRTKNKQQNINKAIELDSTPLLTYSPSSLRQRVLNGIPKIIAMHGSHARYGQRRTLETDPSL